jgi:hypothetical protein
MARTRGTDHTPAAMFSYVSAEERVPRDHPLRAIRTFVDEILREMTREFEALFYSIRIERLSITTSCSGGSWAWRWTSRSGCQRCSARTATGCCSKRWPTASSSCGRPSDGPGYAMSQQARPRIERAFAWLKTIAGLRKVKLRGVPNVDALFVFASACSTSGASSCCARGPRETRDGLSLAVRVAPRGAARQAHNCGS